jgi:hypothetical protein
MIWFVYFMVWFVWFRIRIFFVLLCVRITVLRIVLHIRNAGIALVPRDGFYLPSLDVAAGQNCHGCRS